MRYSEHDRRHLWEATAEQRERIQRGYTSYYQSAFTAFLTLPDTRLDSPQLLDEFETRHIGSFATIQEACDEYLRNIGWLAAADKYLAAIPDEIPPIFWDYSRIAQQLESVYQLAMTDGEIHVFTRRT